MKTSVVKLTSSNKSNC